MGAANSNSVKLIANANAARAALQEWSRTNGKKTVVAVMSDTCGACKSFKPIFYEAAKQMPHVKFYEASNPRINNFDKVTDGTNNDFFTSQWVPFIFKIERQQNGSLKKIPFEGSRSIENIKMFANSS